MEPICFRRGEPRASGTPGNERGHGALEGGGLKFAGLALNAVDAKGRVSLPAGFRSTIERRLQRLAVPEG